MRGIPSYLSDSDEQGVEQGLNSAMATRPGCCAG
jgi:hypothetical protein